MKKLLDQHSVGKDAPKAKSQRPGKHKELGGALTGRNESGQLAEEKEAK